MICGCNLLIIVVLTTVYSAIYTSQVTVPHFQELVTSVEDLAANPDISVYILRGSTTATYVMVGGFI